jgi:hypothetical protein
MLTWIFRFLLLQMGDLPTPPAKLLCNAKLLTSLVAELAAGEPVQTPAKPSRRECGNRQHSKAIPTLLPWYSQGRGQGVFKEPSNAPGCCLAGRRTATGR